MDLFTPQVEKERFHPNFARILEKDNEIKNGSLAGESWEQEKSILQSWCIGFPDRDNKFIKEFQTTFNSSFWEIYLYKLFCDYGFKFNWSYSRPDFLLNTNNIDFIVEATTANKADDERPNEWDKEEPLVNPFNAEAYDYYLKNMNEANRYSMIRLSNAILSKYRKYKNDYSKLDYVKNRPFVIAVAPFEQPFFYHQYCRPIMALLYDYYVDEEAYCGNHGDCTCLPTIYLNSIKKDNDAEIPLGFFKDEYMSEISAVVFSCNATWSKLRKCKKTLMFLTLDGLVMENTYELIEDGLFIFHNPYAKHPLDRSIFKRNRVCQVYPGSSRFGEIKNAIYICLENGMELVMDFGEKHMTFRSPIIAQISPKIFL